MSAFYNLRAHGQLRASRREDKGGRRAFFQHGPEHGSNSDFGGQQLSLDRGRYCNLSLGCLRWRPVAYRAREAEHDGPNRKRATSSSRRVAAHKSLWSCARPSGTTGCDRRCRAVGAPVRSVAREAFSWQFSRTLNLEGFCGSRSLCLSRPGFTAGRNISGTVSRPERPTR